MTNSNLFRLNWSDVGQGAVNAVFVAVFVFLYGIVTQGDFSLFHVDWVSLLNGSIDVAFKAFVGFLGASLLTTQDGKVLGAIKIRR